jgi:HAD superfamily hydrolase (TIGR01549 family)
MISFKNKRVIVFDLDGTIVRLAADWHSLKDVLAKRYNEHYKDACEFKSISSCLSNIVERGDEEELQKNFDIIRKYEIENLNQNNPIEETIFFIKNLSLFDVEKDAKLAVFSLNTRRTIIESLKLASIYEKIDYFVAREDLRKWKPDPEGLLKIRDHYNINGKDMIYIGDLEKDILAGKNAGIDTYYVDELIDLVNQVKK